MDLILQLKALEEEKARSRQISTIKQFSNTEETIETSHSPDSSPVTYREEDKTLEVLTKQADVSYGQLFQYNKILEKG